METSVLLGSGVDSVITGGMVSLGPPEGGVDVLAHDGANSAVKRTIPIINIMQFIFLITL
jgi:hypothetical protein